MKKAILGFTLLLASVGLPARAAIISVNGPAIASGNFDVTVQAASVFAGRDPLTMLVSYGFNIAISNPGAISYLGATSGPLFDPATAEPGTAVFGAASGLGIPNPVAEPLLLVTLHFGAIGVGASDITISSDLSNVFQGLQFLDQPFQEDISGKISVSAVPEPSMLGFLGIGLFALAVGREITLRAKPRKVESEEHVVAGLRRR